MPRYHSDRGRTLASLNRLEDAVDAFDKALTFDRNDAQTWKYKGTPCIRLGEMENAMVCLNRALDLGADEFAIYKMRGRVMEELGRLEDAMDSYAKALAMEPNEPRCWRAWPCWRTSWAIPGKGSGAARSVVGHRSSQPPRLDGAGGHRRERLKRDEEVLTQL